MIEIDFKKIELEDKDLITHYFKHHTSRSCERTFVNVYLWARFYHVKFAEVEHTLVFRTDSLSHTRRENRRMLRKHWMC